MLAATTGMRAEVALRGWIDLDLDTGVLRVAESVIPVGRELVFTPPKTKKGVQSSPSTPARSQ